MSTPAAGPEFESLLDYLKRTRGFDFTGYKRASLMRRVQTRMQVLGMDAHRFSEYMDYLEVHPEEFGHLFNVILINVTAFFRDPPAWEYLATEIIPRIVASKQPDQPIRVWSAGCASGQEAYTLAIVLAETLGMETVGRRVKIYATDVDEEALGDARRASYSTRNLQELPAGLREKYFEPAGERYVLNADLRRVVIFGRHDLIQDAPISRIDLLVCRNTLMYLNSETQAGILDRLHFALEDGGFLFLGKAEMLLTHAGTFTPVDLKQRFFSKVGRDPPYEPMAIRARAAVDAVNPLVDHVRIREAVFDAGPAPQVAVDLSGSLALANESARVLFGLSPRDLGRPLQDLELSYRPVELRSCIDQACEERRPMSRKDVLWSRSSGDLCSLDVEVVPLQDNHGRLLGAMVTFTDVTEQRRLLEELQESKRAARVAYEELQSTNEELETTNEELQSTAEELQTTNEELQSTNEELETMNEELQSTNAELQTINQELQQRSDEFNEVNAFLEAILSSMRGGVVVVDREMLVQIWNHRAEDLWGLRANEVRESHFLNLDIGLPVEQLRPVIRACLAGESEYQEVTLDATNRRGKAMTAHVTCAPLVGKGGDVRGAILLMDEG